MEAVLMKVVWRLNRRWTHDSYFRLHKYMALLTNRWKCPDTMCLFPSLLKLCELLNVAKEDLFKL